MNKPSSNKTLLYLSSSQDASDFWDDFETNSNPISHIYKFPPNGSTTIRMLGPFIKVKYKYRLNDEKWIPKILVNGINVNDKIAKPMVYQLGTMICNEFFAQVDRFCGKGKVALTDMKISGVHAHNITISKKDGNRRYQTFPKFTVKLSKEASYLPDAKLETIYRLGLIDLPKLVEDIIQESNNSNLHFYRINSSYRMPDELWAEDVKGIMKNHAEDEINVIRTRMNDMPDEAFYRAGHVNNPIMNVELD